jgi:hypothetical protein
MSDEKKKQEKFEYRNKTVINQRGGAIEINNATDREEIKISQHSGSNISLNNLTNSELATNNKQTIVVRDEFKTVKNNLNEFVGKDRNIRVHENNYELKGVGGQSEIDAYAEWKDAFKEIAEINSQFKIYRGGKSIPQNVSTKQAGSRASNPVLKGERSTVENKFNGYSAVPYVNSKNNEVINYNKVIDRGKTKPAESRKVSLTKDIIPGCGPSGSNAPGVLEFGADKSAATEEGNWQTNSEATSLDSKIVDKQDELNPIEQKMGNAGDDIQFVKRHKVDTIGAITNDYASIRVDEKGRSQPFESVVGQTGVFKNHDYIPHIEEINNGNNFPCGDYTLNVSNRWNTVVGSGGIQFKTSGTMEIGCTLLKIGASKSNIHSKYGITISSENNVEVSSLKSIQLRTNRQVYIENSLGIRHNVIIGGGTYIEGELFVQHITAPTEVQETEKTKLYGKFNTDTDRTLLIGEANIGGAWYPVFAKRDDDLIKNYDHSHHFNNIPLRLEKSNEDVRIKAQNENINKHNVPVVAQEQVHEHKGLRA